MSVEGFAVESALREDGDEAVRALSLTRTDRQNPLVADAERRAAAFERQQEEPGAQDDGVDALSLHSGRSTNPLIADAERRAAAYKLRAVEATR